LTTGQVKYKVAADWLKEQLNTQPRTIEGGFWHKLKYPNQVSDLDPWAMSVLMLVPRSNGALCIRVSPFHTDRLERLDGVFMALPFYALYTQTYQPKNTTAWNDIALQLRLVHTHTIQSSSHLMVHGKYVALLRVPPRLIVFFI